MANSRSQTVTSGKWAHDWSVGVRVWVERQGQVILDDKIAEVLVALERSRSISGAARAIGISYRHAWLLLQAANEHSGQPLTAAAVGGQRGGGAQLTEHGQAALAVFQRLRQQIRDTAATALPKIIKPVSRDSTTIHLAAAISLQEVVSSLLGKYALVRPTVMVRTLFGASNELAEQIAAGASIDVFISANRKQIGSLAKAELIDRTSRRQLACNGLVIVGDPSFTGKLRKPADLASLDCESVVVADPDCPLGECTAALLKTAKLTERLKPRLRYADNSRAVVNSMRAPGKRVGIIFGTDVAHAVNVTPLLQIPPENVAAEYHGAAVATSTVLEEARDLLAFMASPDGMRSFRDYGFAV